MVVTVGALLPCCNLDSKSLSHVSTIKDLGVAVSNDLKWNNHIDHILAKGYRMLSFLRRHTLKSFDENTRKLLHLSFIRPHIGYASKVWAPQEISNLTRIERLQRRATKYRLNMNYYNSVPYRDRLIRLNLLPVSYWHELKDLVFYFKCRTNHYKIPINDFVAPHTNVRTTRHSSASDVKLFQAGYFNRITKLWYNLPSSVRTSPSSYQFKYSLFKYYNNALNNAYNPDVFNTLKSICCKCCSFCNI